MFGSVELDLPADGRELVVYLQGAKLTLQAIPGDEPQLAGAAIVRQLQMLYQGTSPQAENPLSSADFLAEVATLLDRYGLLPGEQPKQRLAKFPQFKRWPLVHSLLQAGEVQTFAELPETCQQVVIYYMAVATDSWAVRDPAFRDWKWGGEHVLPSYTLFDAMYDDIRRFLERFEQHYGHVHFGVADVDCRQLAEAAELYAPGIPPGFLTASTRIPPRPWKTVSIWPCVIEPTREVIAHGHSYLIDRLDVGVPTTPVVWLAAAEDLPQT